MITLAVTEAIRQMCNTILAGVAKRVENNVDGYKITAYQAGIIIRIDLKEEKGNG